MFQTEVVEKIKTHILYSATFFPPENCAVYEIILKNNIKQVITADDTIWRMRIVWWIPKATHTLGICNTYCFFPLQQWLHELVSTLPYTYIACRVSIVHNHGDTGLKCAFKSQTKTLFSSFLNTFHY